MMQVDRRLNPNTNSPGDFSIRIHRTHGVPTRNDPTTTARFPRLLNLIDPVFPEAMVSLVNALRLATRRVMRNGAMTYPSA
jgi:hypothetical protein